MLNKFAAPIDYLVIGHIASDLLPDGTVTLGGTAAYAALTATALGLKTAILTAVGIETPLEALEEVPIAGIEAEQSTTFANVQTGSGRRQFVHHTAPILHPHMLPEVWRSPAIVHFAPLLDEIDFNLLRLFPDSLVCVTPQGWLRSAGPDGLVVLADWLDASYVLGLADAVVLSIEDLAGDEHLVERFAEKTSLLVVTEGAAGARVFQHGSWTHFPAPIITEIDSTGAGDIFAAAFFVQLHRTGDAQLATAFAVQLASQSVNRRFMESIPTEQEIYQAARMTQATRTAAFSP